MNYTSLEQRMAHAYLDMFPPFVPLTGGPVSAQSQEQFYAFVKSVYQTIFDAPELFFKTLHVDDAHPNRYNRSSYGKPRLYNDMKKVLTAIDELVQVLFELGQNGTPDGERLMIAEGHEVKKKHLALLPHLGLRLEGRVLSNAQYDNLFSAWHWLATREQATLPGFARCQFDPGHSYIQDIYRSLFGSAADFDTLVDYLQSSGYIRGELLRGPYTLDYVRQAVDKEVPLGDPKHGDPYHYGIAAEYMPYASLPQYMVLRIIEMKTLLLNFEQMPERVKGFTVKYAKECDDCGYCTQTHKTGTRKRLDIAVDYNGIHQLCPLYPGFNFTFTTIDKELAGNLIAFLEFMDAQINAKQGEKVGGRI